MIETTLTLICDDCKDPSATFVNTSGTEVRRGLEKIGWTHIAGKDRCRTCTGKRLENPLVRAGRSRIEREISLRNSKP